MEWCSLHLRCRIACFMLVFFFLGGGHSYISCLWRSYICYGRILPIFFNTLSAARLSKTNLIIIYLPASGLATHYRDVILSAMASQITGVSIVYLNACSDVDHRNIKVNSPHKWPITRKYFHLMTLSCLVATCRTFPDMATTRFWFGTYTLDGLVSHKILKHFTFSNPG